MNRRIEGQACLVAVVCCLTLYLSAGTAAVRADQITNQTKGTETPSEVVTESAPAPKIAVDETNFDFGVVWSGDKLEHAFKITNAGDALLEITKVQTGCGCTVAGEYPEKLQPGESGLFPFSMQSTRLHGAFSKPVTITSNDPVTPSLKLYLRGQCRHRFDLQPQAVRFDSVYGGSRIEQKVTITNNLGVPLKLELDAAATNEWFEFELKETKPGKEFELRAVAKPPSQAGTRNTTVKLKTNMPDQEEISIPVYMRIVDRIEIQPTQILVGHHRQPTGAADRPVTRTIRLVNHGDTPVKVSEATVDDPELTATVEAQQEGQVYQIRVQMPASYVPPRTGHTLTITTDDPEKATITVPITLATVRPARQAQAARAGAAVPNKGP